MRLKLRRVTGFSGQAIAGFAKRSLEPHSTVVSDGFHCFASVKQAGCSVVP